MVQIPQYTRGIIQPRQTANIATGNVDNTMGFAAATTDQAAQVTDAYVRAGEATALNEVMIKKQKEDLEFFDTARKQYEGNPDGFAKTIEATMQKRNQDYASQLPTDRARAAFVESANKYDLNIYENSYKWEQTRKAEVYASRIGSALDDNEVLALRAGREGAPIDDILKNVDATVVAASTVFSRDKLDAIRYEGRQKALVSWMQGQLETNPTEVKNILDSKKYDAELGSQNISKLYDSASQQEEAIKKAEEKKLLESQEVSVRQRLKNQQVMADDLLDDSLTFEQKIARINEADFKGEIDDKYAIEARRYINSLNDINTATDSSTMAQITTRMYDLNAMSDMNERDYLIGIDNIKRDILAKSSAGELSRDDAKKLNNQLKTLSSAKVADATNSIASSFSDANKIINNNLPPEYRGDAVRKLFYSTTGDEMKAINPKDKEAIKTFHRMKSQEIVDSINSQRRQKVIEKVNQLSNNQTTSDLDFIKSKGYTMDDVSETAKKYNMTEAQVIQQLKAK